METNDGSQIYKMYRVKCKMQIHQGIYTLNLKYNISLSSFIRARDWQNLKDTLAELAFSFFCFFLIFVFFSYFLFFFLKFLLSLDKVTMYNNSYYTN